MNRKQFAILLVLLIVLGGAGWWVQQSRNRNASAGESGSGKKLLGDSFPVNDVADISIKQNASELNLVKKDDTWRVSERSDYPANFSQISEFLLKLRDLKVVQTEDVGPSQLSRMQLAPAGQGTNSGTILDLKNQAGKSLATLTLGKKHMAKAPPQQQQFQMGEVGFPDGRYLLDGANSATVLLVGEPFSNIEPKPEAWLNKDFFKVERPKVIAVSFPVATNSWKIERDTDSGDWKLADAKGDEKLDAARATDVSNPFSSPSFNDVLAGAKAEGTDKPTVITIETFDDFTYTVKVGTKTNDNYPITVDVTANFPKTRTPANDEKPEDAAKADKAWKDRQAELDKKLKDNQKFANWTYLVASWTVDPLLKERKDLLAEKKEEPKPADTSTNAPATGESATNTLAK